MQTQHKVQIDERDKNPGIVRPPMNPYIVSSPLSPAFLQSGHASGELALLLLAGLSAASVPAAS